MFNLKAILDREGEITRDKIRQNFSISNPYATPDNNSGKAKNLKVITTDTKLIIESEADYIHSLEEGISPDESRNQSSKDLRDALYAWSVDEFGGFNPFQLEGACNKQRTLGSVLYRHGGRTDLWTDEINPLIERLKEAIGEEITDLIIINNSK